MTIRVCNSVIILAALTFLTIAGCNSEKEEKSTKKKDDRILPPSLGKSGELLVIMDTALWKRPLGEAIKGIVQQDYPGILQGEPYFKVRNVHPFRMSNTLEKFRTLIYVITLDNPSASGKEMEKYISTELKQQILTNQGSFMLLRRDVDAENQVIMILYNAYTDTLTQLITKYQDYLTNTLEKETVQQSAIELKAKRDGSIEEKIRNHSGLQINMPKGYTVAKSDSQFLWIRSLNDKIDRSFIISWEDYLSQEQLKKTGMLDTRDMVLKPNLTGSGFRDTISFMMTENMAPIEYTVIQDQPFTAQIRGLWKLKNNARGGSFVARTILDEQKNRVYYIEGLVYAPGQSKRDLIREFIASMESVNFTK